MLSISRKVNSYHPSEILTVRLTGLPEQSLKKQRDHRFINKFRNMLSYSETPHNALKELVKVETPFISLVKIRPYHKTGKLTGIEWEGNMVGSTL